MPVEMSDDEFDELVSDALDSIPAEFMERLDNVVFLVEAQAPEGTDLLGLYEGVPLTERWWGAAFVPDRIVVFREPTLRMAGSPAEVAEQVRITVVHEIAHHFGIDDAHLDALGWG